MKLIGTSCLTENFNMIPQGYNEPVDVANDGSNYPPLSNPEYFTPGENYFKKEGAGVIYIVQQIQILLQCLKILYKD